MLLSGGAFDIVVTRPLSGAIFALMAVVVVHSTVMGIRRQRRGHPASRYAEELESVTPHPETEGGAGAATTEDGAERTGSTRADRDLP